MIHPSWGFAFSEVFFGVLVGAALFLPPGFAPPILFSFLLGCCLDGERGDLEQGTLRFYCSANFRFRMRLSPLVLLSFAIIWWLLPEMIKANIKTFFLHIGQVTEFGAHPFSDVITIVLLIVLAGTVVIRRISSRYVASVLFASCLASLLFGLGIAYRDGLMGDSFRWTVAAWVVGLQILVAPFSYQCFLQQIKDLLALEQWSDSFPKIPPLNPF